MLEHYEKLLASLGILAPAFKLALLRVFVFPSMSFFLGVLGECFLGVVVFEARTKVK